jgi:hypothetical protein
MENFLPIGLIDTKNRRRGVRKPSSQHFWHIPNRPLNITFMYRRPILCTLYGAVDFLNVLKKYIVRHSTATSYPSIENLFNGCQGHPPFCLPPGTAQRQPDRIKKGSNAQQFIQLTVVGDINAKRGWSLKTEKIRLLWHVHIHWYYSHITASISDMN